MNGEITSVTCTSMSLRVHCGNEFSNFNCLVSCCFFGLFSLSLQRSSRLAFLILEERDLPPPLRRARVALIWSWISFFRRFRFTTGGLLPAGRLCGGPEVPVFLLITFSEGIGCPPAGQYVSFFLFIVNRSCGWSDRFSLWRINRKFNFTKNSRTA